MNRLGDMIDNYAKKLESYRSAIAAKVRDLRQGRRWTQAELSGHLGISQGRLSELERGAGSFSAEQLLLVLSLFNVPITELVPPGDPLAELQNALARLGASELRENVAVLPSERFAEATRVALEVLVVGATRHLLALAPVLVQQIDSISLARLDTELRDRWLDRRLPWLAENVLTALRSIQTGDRNLGLLYRRAAVVLERYLAAAPRRLERTPDLPLDVLDTTIRSHQTLDDVIANRSEISRRWGVVTPLQPADFAAALEATHAGN